MGGVKMIKYFKDNKNNVYAYSIDGSQDEFIGDKVAMTETEIEAHINPPKTAEQLAQDASILRDKAMLTGIDYQGSMISLTDVDGNGMLQVKAAFEMGLPATMIHFKNGTKLPMTATDFPAFALWFVTERNRFFV